MTPFIKSLVDEIAATHTVDGVTLDLGDETYVFPNRRAGLFFSRELARLSAPGNERGIEVVVLPRVFDINKYVEQISGLRRADDIELLLLLYTAYRELHPDEPLKLSSFIAQGRKMLHDFDEIDKYNVDAARLYRNLHDLDATSDVTPLDDQQAEAIRRIFRVDTAGSSELKYRADFSTFWHDMGLLYARFNQLMDSRGIGTEGSIFRRVANSADPALFRGRRIVFAGFNILTRTEEMIISRFEQPAARFVPDYNAVVRTEPGRDYHVADIEEFHFHIPDDIRRYPALNSVDQADCLRSVLDELLRTNTPEQIVENTAIILADESLLPEVLDAVPDAFPSLNITMGYTLSNTPVATLVDCLMALQAELPGRGSVYHKLVTDLLSHPYIGLICPDRRLVATLLSDIRANSKLRVALDELRPLNEAIFANADNIFDYLDAVFTAIETAIAPLAARGTNRRSNRWRLESEFVAQYRHTITRLNTYLTRSGISVCRTGNAPTAQSISFSDCALLIKRMARGIKVQFVGEPLHGLQIMGLLECRLLDFENVIFLGFNEQFIPGTQRASLSFIPYSLREPFGLPTHETTNSIYAYNFYRMLHRASRLALIYNESRDEYEPSRFLAQLQYLHTTSGAVTTGDSAHRPAITSAHQDFRPYVNREAARPIERLSPSSLKTYIKCPLWFYYSRILHIHDPQEVEETMQANTFGSILHRALELYYDRRCEPTDAAISELLDEAYRHVKEVDYTNQGYDVIAYNAIRKMVKAVIDADISDAESGREVIGTEVHYGINTSHPDLETKTYADPRLAALGSHEIRITPTDEDGNEICSIPIDGVIDRIDSHSDVIDGPETIRVIDYKTSKAENTPIYDNLFSSEHARDVDLEAMQVLLYCYILKHNGFEKAQLVPQLYKTYTIVKEGHLKEMSISIDGMKPGVINYGICKDGQTEVDLAARFERDLHQCVTRLVSDFGNDDALKAFADRAEQHPDEVMAPNEDSCKFCKFPDLCMRHVKKSKELDN